MVRSVRRERRERNPLFGKPCRSASWLTGEHSVSLLFGWCLYAIGTTLYAISSDRNQSHYICHYAWMTRYMSFRKQLDRSREPLRETMGAFSLLYRIWYLNRGPSLFRVWRNNGKQKKQYHSVVMRPSFSLVYGCRGKVNVSCFTDTFSSRPMCDLSICWWVSSQWWGPSLSLMKGETASCL